MIIISLTNCSVIYTTISHVYKPNWWFFNEATKRHKKDINENKLYTLFIALSKMINYMELFKEGYI